VSEKFNVNSPPDQLFELLKITPPFKRWAVISEADPPTGVVTATTTPPRPTPSGLEFVTENFSTGTLAASGNCVESGGVPATVATASTGGVEVGVKVWVKVGVKVSVLVNVSVKVGVEVDVKVSVGVLVGVKVGVKVLVNVGVKVGVKVLVKVGVSVDVFVNVKVGVKVAVAAAMVMTAPPTGTPVAVVFWPDTLSTACRAFKVVV
jgi:hypothetical protein